MTDKITDETGAPGEKAGATPTPPPSDVPPSDVPKESTPEGAGEKAGATPTPPAETKPVEQLAKEKATAPWAFKATKVRCHWPEGKLLAAAEYDAEIDSTLNDRIG